MSAINLNKLNSESSSLLKTATTDDPTAKQNEQPLLAPSDSYTPSTTNQFSYNNSTLEQRVQHQVQQHQLFLHRQNSMRFTNYVKKKNDLESKINRFYSFLLVKYHWAFLLIGLIITIVLTGCGFLKQPLPNFLDPKRGFGARGEGTLTSQLIVMKNVNTELTKHQKYILDLYEDVKRRNITDFGDYDSKGTDYIADDYNTDDDSSKSDSEPEPLSDDSPQDDSKDRTKRSDQGETETLEENELNKFDFVWKGIQSKDIVAMLPKNHLIITDDPKSSNHAFSSLEHCSYSLGLDENLEFYFHTSSLAKLHNFDYFKNLTRFNSTSLNSNQSKYFNDIDVEYRINSDSAFDDINLNVNEYLKTKEENLLNLRKLKSLCAWDHEVIRMLTQFQKEKKKELSQPLCYFSLPQSIAILNNKTDCMQLEANDVRYFLSIIRECYDLQKSGILYAAADEYKQKPEIINLMNKNNPITKFFHEPLVRNNICFKKNLLHIVYEYLVDNEFLSFNSTTATKSTQVNNSTQSYNVKISSLLIINSDKLDSKEKKKIFEPDLMFDFYLKYFHHQRYDDKETNLIGINLMGIRQDAAMRFIGQEMSLVGLAIILIVTVTLLYLKSVVISMIVNLGVGMSVGVAFFAYRIVFDIDLFPFINMMAAFLLIGIACDNVFVLFDSWYTEKAKIIMEDLPVMIEKQYSGMNSNNNNNNNTNVVDTKPVDEYLLPPMFIERQFIKKDKFKSNKNSVVKFETSNSTDADNEAFLNQNHNNNNNNESKLGLNNNAVNIELLERGITLDQLNKYELNPAYVRLAPLSDEQMIRIMGGTLRHAASSIFVTSFTTAAAFLTNYITKLPYVQLFGVFTGTCIIVYFTMVITMVAAFVITYEKHIQLWRCKLKPNFTTKLEESFDKLMAFLALINYKLVAKSLPNLLIRYRFVWFSIFFILGIVGMVVVFHYPQLKPPATWRYQFFKTGNLFEEFEFNIRDRFWSYVNEEKRNLTNPEIFFVFGIYNKDTGRVFNPDDDGYLMYDKNFDFLAPESQIWLNNFINVSLANRSDLFLVDEIVREWKEYLFSMQQFCYNKLNIDPSEIYSKIYLPYKRESLSECQQEVNNLLVNSSIANFENLMSSFPRRIIFMSKGHDVNGILLRINANRTFSDHGTVNDYYLSLKKFHDETFAKAPKGFDTGWFISVGFALYDLQNQLINGTYSSLVASMIIALIILLLTSGNVIISFFAILTISFSIAVTIAIFVFMGWNLSILESVIIIMSVGLSVDFSCHYGVAYINADEKEVENSLSLMRLKESFNQPKEQDNEANKKESNKKLSNTSTNNTKSATSCKLSKFVEQCIQKYQMNDQERFARIRDIFIRVGSAVLMAAFTTFLAGFSMYPSGLTSFSRMGQFLMLVMCTSYLYATFFFVPLCAICGPTHNFGALNFKKLANKIISSCKKKPTNSKETKRNKSMKSFNDNEDANFNATSAATNTALAPHI